MSLSTARERRSINGVLSVQDRVVARLQSNTGCVSGDGGSLNYSSDRNYHHSGGSNCCRDFFVRSHGLRLTKSRSESSLGSALITDSEGNGVDQQRFNLAISRLPQPKLKLKRRRSFVAAVMDSDQDCSTPGTGSRATEMARAASVSLEPEKPPQHYDKHAPDHQLPSAQPAANEHCLRLEEGYHCLRQENDQLSTELTNSGRQHQGGSHNSAVMSLSCISERSECSSIGSFQISGAVSSVMMPGPPMDHSLMFSSTISTLTDITGGSEVLNNVEPPSMMHSVISIHDRSPTLSRKDLPLLIETRNRLSERSHGNTALEVNGKCGDRTVTMQNSLLLLDSMTDSVFDLDRVKPPPAMDEIDMENSLFNLDSLRSESDFDSAATLTQNTADRTLQPSSFHSQGTDQTIELASEIVDSDTDLCTTEELPVDEPSHSKASNSLKPFVARNVWLKSCTSTDPLSVRDSSSECLSHESTDYSDEMTITISNPDTTATETLCHSCSSRISKTFPQSGYGLTADIRSDSGSMLNKTCDTLDNNSNSPKKCFISAKLNPKGDHITSISSVTKSQSINDSLCDVFSVKYKPEVSDFTSGKETTDSSQTKVENTRTSISEKPQRQPIKLARTRSDRSCFSSDKNKDEPIDGSSSKKLLYSAPWRSNMRREVRHVSPARRITNTPRRNERPQSATGDRDSSCSRITVRETKTTQLRRATTVLLGNNSLGLPVRDRSADARTRSPAMNEATTTPSPAKALSAATSASGGSGGDSVINKRKPIRRTQPPRPLSTDLSLLQRPAMVSVYRTFTRQNTSSSSFGASLRSAGSSRLQPDLAKRHISSQNTYEPGDDESERLPDKEQPPAPVSRQRTFTLDDKKSDRMPQANRSEPPVRRPSVPPRPRTSPPGSGVTLRSELNGQHLVPRHSHLNSTPHQQRHQQTSGTQPKQHEPVIPKSISCDSGLRTTTVGCSDKASVSGVRPSRRVGLRLSSSGNSALQSSVRTTATAGIRPVNVMAVIQPYNYRPPDRQNTQSTKIIEGTKSALKRRGDLI